MPYSGELLAILVVGLVLTIGAKEVGRKTGHGIKAIGHKIVCHKHPKQ